MKSIALSLFILLSVSGYTQKVDIYFRWAAFPDLAIDFPQGDSLDGSSEDMSRIGMQYFLIDLNKSLKNSMTKIMISAVNRHRVNQGVDTVNHNNALDEISKSEIFSWITEMNSFHQIDKFSFPFKKDEEIYNSLTNTDQFTFYHYPFQWGKNIVLLASASNFTSSRKKCIRYLKQEQDRVINHTISSMMLKKGSSQNLLNKGYATVGFYFQLIKGIFDNFYFDESGRRVEIKRRRNPCYYFMLSQTFSVNDN